MKLANEVSPEKLRGGFYSPAALVQVCLNRVSALSPKSGSIRLLEPSAGDGAFVRGLAQHPLRDRIRELVAVEILASEVRQCRLDASALPVTTTVYHGSFLDDFVRLEAEFDAVVGNPPFVRFQFVDSDDRRRADNLALDLGITLRGVSNLWIPIFLKSISCVRTGGAFAFILPAEFLTGISASMVRDWLLRNATDLQIDMFPASSFPGVLQEVVVLSGRRFGNPEGRSKVTVLDHNGGNSSWTHTVSPGAHTWTKLLLTPSHIDAFAEATALPGCIQLGAAVRFSVATVTGANDFFSVDAATIEKYSLQRWVKPLLPRIRNSPGLAFTVADYESIVATGAKASLLDFSRDAPDPLGFAGPRTYLAIGEQHLLHERYKCRIRSPWYRVPVVPPGQLLLSKRSHLYPRVVLNSIAALTTDTIYQGKLIGPHKGREKAIVTSFHNSLTMLSAEIEGRSFGGGVLELVPSEVARLRIFVADQLAEDLAKLDKASRSTDTDKDQLLIEETDRRLAKAVPGLSDSVLATLADARYVLLQRRLDRNRSTTLEFSDEEPAANNP